MPTEKYKVVIIDQAKADIDEILSYVREYLHNPSAAAKLLDAILNTVDTLSAFPYSMPLIVNTVLTNGQEYRRAIVDNFVLIYKIVADKYEVRIMAAFNAMSDVFTRFLSRL